MVLTAESPAAKANFSPKSILRTNYMNLVPKSSTIGNTGLVFQGPAFIKHMYFLHQQDKYEATRPIAAATNWKEIEMTLYDSADTTNLGSPIYQQVVPQGIPDGALQSILDEFMETYNEFIDWIDENLIGDSTTCADYDVEGSYTGTLAQECQATDGSDECRKLNRLVCYFNYGLDKVVDFATGYHYPTSGSTGPCVGSSSTSDVTNSESDYAVSLSTACGGAACTKLNDLVCKMNWAMVKLDDTAIGDSTSCSTTGTSSCTTNCSGTNRLICYINYLVKEVYSVSFGGNSISYYFGTIHIPSWNLGSLTASVGGPSVSSVNAGWLDYISWEVPTRNYISQNWAPRKDFIALRGTGSDAPALNFDFDNYNRNQGFQVTFPEPGLYVSNGLIVKQNSDNTSANGSLAQTHTNIIYQQASINVDSKTGQVYSA